MVFLCENTRLISSCCESSLLQHWQHISICSGDYARDLEFKNAENSANIIILGPSSSLRPGLPSARFYKCRISDKTDVSLSIYLQDYCKIKAGMFGF